MIPHPLLAQSAGAGLGTFDWLTILLYFGLLLGITAWAVSRKRDTAEDYFLAGRHLGWWIVGASIFASNIGSEHLVGLAGSGATDGVAMAHYELHAWCLLVLGWLLVPFYMRSRVYTMPEFLERRFSPASRWVLSIISLLAYILTKVAVGIYAGGVVFSALLPEVSLNLGFIRLDSFWVGSIAVLFATGLYTVLGGMRAVAYTEALQTVVLVLGSIFVTLFGLAKLGGWSELRAVLPSEMFNLWKPLVPAGVEGTWAPVLETNAAGEVVRQAWYFNGNFPWLGMLVCAPVIGMWYWCTDQYIVQRALGAKSERDARRGTIFAAYLKLLPVFIFIIPGMICFALALSGKVPELNSLLTVEGGQTVANRSAAQGAYPLMVSHVLPVGLRGIVVAGLLAALMSSLAGVFNASSTLFTVDLYQKFRPAASQHELVRMGRIAVGAMVAVGLLWIPVIKGSQGLYFYLQAMQGYLAPPIFAVFFMGIFLKRLNGPGCLAALLVGFAMGLFRLAVDTPIALGMDGYAQGYPPGSFLWIVNQIYFQYFSILILLVSAATMLGVSYLTAPPSDERIRGLTFATVTPEQRSESRSSWGRGEVIASALVLVLILMAYLYFRG
ncbi:MAG: sodium:solute symporter [Verrucomicrobiae bacterium]|nr:sodium:solute symporter [Verrucomicrobiae bacterium]